MNVPKAKSGRILITGGTSGLGLELVKSFLGLGYEVFATGRDQKKVLHFNNNFHFIKVDFSNLKEAADVFNGLEKKSISFDIIINNAGILSPPVFTVTDDGIEYTFQVNFLSHLLLDELIISRRNNTEPLTVVSVTSPVYKYVKPDFKLPDKNSYHLFKTYAESKLYVLLIGEYLRNKYPLKYLRLIGYNPGVFSSGIYRMQNKWFQSLYQIAAPFMRSPVKVASSLVKILELENLLNGAIYRSNKRFINPEFVRNENAGKFMKGWSNFITPYLK